LSTHSAHLEEVPDDRGDPKTERPRVVYVDLGPDVEPGWCAGGDCSLQGQFCVYAVVALPETQLQGLSDGLDAAIAAHVQGIDPRIVELHAKDIWNGSARKRTPLRGITTKEAMVDLFRVLSETISRYNPMIAVAVWHLEEASEPGNRKFLKLTKQVLINLAFGRLNTNLKSLRNKNLGRPVFLFDRETDTLISPRGPAEGPGGMSDVEFVSGGTGLEPVKLRRKVDPLYRETDSRESRLVQVADLAAYFTGKYLTHHSLLADLVTRGQFELSEENWRRMGEANFCLGMIETLNAEAVLAIPIERFSRQPPWMKKISLAFQDFIDMKPDLICCSFRDAIISPSDKPPRLNGVGYWMAGRQR
jgi:hypothetical protein